MGNLNKFNLAEEILNSANMTIDLRASEIQETLDELTDSSEYEVKRTMLFLTQINLKINEVSQLIGDIIEDLKGM